MLSLLNTKQPTTYSNTDKTKPNVVIILLESFSKEYMQLKNPEATPYLNELAKKSVFFDKAYANGRRSIEGVASVLSGIPALMEEPFVNSEFSANQIIGLGTLLGSNGYHTSFFHGAKNGSMHFDQFSKSVGIENYFGKSEYPNALDDDGTWGIFDEPFLRWTCAKYSDFPKPFFSTIFTLSSHQPFKIPDQFENDFSDGRAEILKAIRYSDYALKQFFACAEKQDWYKNTVFILTADHTGPALTQADHFESRFEVPILFYTPVESKLSQLSSKQFAQHIDILPTLLESLQIQEKKVNYLARSLWQPGPKVIALYSDGNYELVGDIVDKPQQLKAIQQYFSEGLYDNRLYYPIK